MSDSIKIEILFIMNAFTYSATWSTSSHLYAVAGMSNQLYRSWWNQDELKKIKSVQKAEFLKLFPGLLQSFLILFNDVTTRRDRPPTSLRFPTPELNKQMTKP